MEASLHGGDRQLESYEQLAQRLEIADVAQFPGSVAPGEPLCAALGGVEIFLVPHLTSDFGRAYCERAELD